MSETWNPVGAPFIEITTDPPASAPKDERPEFDRFKDLAGKLTKVPKSEVDEKRKK